MNILSYRQFASAPVRVCHVQVLPLLSGVQRAMLEIFKQVDCSRYELHVACQGAGPLTDELERLDIPWHAVGALDRPIHPGRDWQAYCALYELFRRLRFDVVHTHSSKPGILGRVAARRAGVPAVIHHIQGFAFHEYSPRLKRVLYSRLERWAGKYCDRIIFVNQEERKLSIDSGWLPAEKCLTIYNGVELERFTPSDRQAARRQARARWQLADDEVAIVFAGRLEPQKQPLALADIAQALRQHKTANRWRLIVAGDGALGDKLRSRIEAYGLGERVSLIGWQDDPRVALALADVVLLPSLFEGLSVALIEAQAAGLPIVASNVKGNREVVTTGTGFLAAATEPGDYAHSLAMLVDDPLLRGRLGRAARHHAEAAFDGPANMRQVVDVYDDLLGLGRMAHSAVQAA